MRKDVTRPLATFIADLAFLRKAHTYERKADEPLVSSRVAFALRYNDQQLSSLEKTMIATRDALLKERGARRIATGWSFLVEDEPTPAERREAERSAATFAADFRNVEEEEHTIALQVLTWDEVAGVPFPGGWLPAWMVELPEDLDEAASTNGKVPTRRKAAKA